jgi:2-polyprenyl-3-methyl-5-hydroxy-6-metoxy-1,4-benzoquinol methylase
MAAEQQFIHRVLDHLKPPAGSSILEVGCGQGENCRAMAAEGFEVTGIDASAEDISVALESEQEKLHFFTHDIRLPFFINYFDYAFILFSNFGFYHTQREHNNAIRTIANSLKPGGVLLIDYGNLHHSVDDVHAPLALEDFNDMFAFHGLQMKEVLGDHSLNPYEMKKSPRLIMIAQKK